MAVLTSVAGALALFTAGLHAVPGGREILQPTLAAPVGPIVRGTQHAAWHLLTWHFGVLGVALLLSPMWSPAGATAIAWLAGVSALGHAAIFVVVGLRRFGDLWHLPQWVLFVPLAVTSLAAPYAEVGWSTAPRWLAGLVALVLVLIGALHVAWALGSTFPARDRDALVGLVVGTRPGTPMPGRAATVAVALALFVAAGWVAALGGLVTLPVPAAWLDAGAAALIAVFGMRGLGGFFEPALRKTIRGTPYQRYSRVLYSPLALAIATGVLVLRLGR